MPGGDFNVPFDEAIAWVRESRTILPAEFYGARLQAAARSFSISGLAQLDQLWQVTDATLAASR